MQEKKQMCRPVGTNFTPQINDGCSQQLQEMSHQPYGMMQPHNPQFLVNQQVQSEISGWRDSNIYLHGQLDSALGNIKKLEALNAALHRKVHRKRTGFEFAELAQGIVFVEHFDNGDHQAIMPFSQIITRAEAQYVQSNTLRQNGEYFFLCFSLTNEKTVTEILPISFLKRGEALLDLLVDHGIQLSMEIRYSDISSALKTFIRRKLCKSSKSSNVLMLSPLAGWNREGIYQDGSVFPVISNIYEDDFPIIRRLFNRVTMTEEHLKSYKAEFHQFADLTARYFFSLFPVVSILFSLLDKIGRKPQIMLNLLCIDEVSPYWAADLLQVLSRDRPTILEAGDTLRHIEADISRMSDETILIDARYESHAPRSRKDNIRSNLLRLEGYVSGTLSLLNHERLRGLIAILSCKQNITGSVVNIEVPEMSEIYRETHRSFVDYRCLEAFLTLIVGEVESDVNGALSLLASPVEVVEPLLESFASVERLVNSILQKHGYPRLAEILDVPDNFIHTMTLEDSDELDARKLMRTIVRRSIPQLRICEKISTATYHANCIYYDDENVYIPTKVLKEAFQRQFHAEKFRIVLRDLKNDGLLFSNSEQNTFKMQVDGKKSDFYKLNRSFLTEHGQIELMSLAHNILG